MYGKPISAGLYGMPPFAFTRNTTVLGGVAADIFKAIAHYYQAIPVMKGFQLAFSLNKDYSIGGSMGEVQ